MRPLIVLDVDGVLYRWGSSARRVMAAKFGIGVSEDEWFAEEHFTPEQWKWMQSDEAAADIFGNGDAFEGAAYLAMELRRLGRLRIMTAVPENARKARTAWLHRVGIKYDDIVFVEPTNNGIDHTSKSAVLPHASVYIDDNPNNCIDLAKNTDALVLLVNHSWNEGPEVDESTWIWPNIVRVHSWSDIIRLTSDKLAARYLEEAIGLDDVGSELQKNFTEDSTTAKTLLEEAGETVYGRAETDYGHPFENFTAIAKLFNGYLAGRNLLKNDMDAVDAAQLLVLLKVGRFATGARKRDTLVDQAGYAAVTARISGMDA